MRVLILCSEPNSHYEYAVFHLDEELAKMVLGAREAFVELRKKFPALRNFTIDVRDKVQFYPSGILGSPGEKESREDAPRMWSSRKDLLSEELREELAEKELITLPEDLSFHHSKYGTLDAADTQCNSIMIFEKSWFLRGYREDEDAGIETFSRDYDVFKRVV